MRDPLWELPQTEEGFLELLKAVEERRSGDDRDAYGSALLVLGHRVMWVRSDNEEPPFLRSTTLANEAVKVFRETGNKQGLIDALCAGAMQAPEITDAKLAEARALASEIGDGLRLAKVTQRMASAMGLRDSCRAAELNRQALEQYRALGNESGEAQCLFGLAITESEPQAKASAAFEAYELYTKIGDLQGAGRALDLAIMYGERAEGLEAQEPLILKRLEIAQGLGDFTSEGFSYNHLSKIAKLRGDKEAAKKFKRWSKEIESSDGLTDPERRRQHAEFAKELKAMMKLMK